MTLSLSETSQNCWDLTTCDSQDLKAVRIDDSTWSSYMKFHLYSIKFPVIETSDAIKNDSVCLIWCVKRKTRQSMLELWHNRTENLLSWRIFAMLSNISMMLTRSLEKNRVWSYLILVLTRLYIILQNRMRIWDYPNKNHCQKPVISRSPN